MRSKIPWWLFLGIPASMVALFVLSGCGPINSAGSNANTCKTARVVAQATIEAAQVVLANQPNDKEAKVANDVITANLAILAGLDVTCPVSETGK